ncbi:MAG: hypothetical protein IT372_05085 [Polyangiaceae bacterium]|nr:hypothetical protein [Polyangiaceae bacterium]
MSDFWRTLPGRVLTTSAGIALTGGGVAAMAGESTKIAVLCISLLLATVTGVFGVGLAVNSSLKHAAAGAVFLPVMFFVYVLGLGYAVLFHVEAAGYPLVILGLLALSRALLLKPEAERRAGEQRSQVHAH